MLGQVTAHELLTITIGSRNPKAGYRLAEPPGSIKALEPGPKTFAANVSPAHAQQNRAKLTRSNLSTRTKYQFWFLHSNCRPPSNNYQLNSYYLY